MTDLFLLSRVEMRRIERYFPLSHGVARVDDRRIVSAIVFVIKNGLRWRGAPPGYGPHKTIYNRFIRWSRLGVFNKIFAELARKGGKPERLMIDATHLKAHRTAASLLKKGPVPRRIGRTKGGLNSKLHAVKPPRKVLPQPSSNQVLNPDPRLNHTNTQRYKSQTCICWRSDLDRDLHAGRCVRAPRP